MCDGCCPSRLYIIFYGLKIWLCWCIPGSILVFNNYIMVFFDAKGWIHWICGFVCQVKWNANMLAILETCSFSLLYNSDIAITRLSANRLSLNVGPINLQSLTKLPKMGWSKVGGIASFMELGWLCAFLNSTVKTGINTEYQSERVFHFWWISKSFYVQLQPVKTRSTPELSPERPEISVRRDLASATQRGALRPCQVFVPDFGPQR